jgi:poly(A) polymerase Pap1
MKKIDEMYKYLNENGGRDKDHLVKHLVKEFGISKKSAETYYYRWKKEFMKTSKCVPKDLVKKINNKDVDEVKEKAREVEKINIDYEPKEKKSNLQVTSMTIKGQYADYIKDGDKVICGNETFYSIEDLEEYKKKEIANFYARLGEILEVFELEVR